MNYLVSKITLNFDVALRSIVSLCAAVFCSLYIVQFLNVTGLPTYGFVNALLRSIPLTILFFFIFYSLLEENNKKLDLIFKYRHLVCVGIFLSLVIFQINGSSVGVWSEYLPDSQNVGLLWGTPRSIRSDEWACILPFTVSQDLNYYAEINSFFRGGASTSVGLIPQLPVFSLIEIFKPNFWGYLFFGLEAGVAWDWAFFVVGLFVVTVDFAYILTRTKTLSLLAGFLITFSPHIQWWDGYATLLFGQAGLLFLYLFLSIKSQKAKALSFAAMAWMAGCYLFIAYPPRIVSCFYVLAVLAIYLIIKRVHESKKGYKFHLNKYVVFCIFCSTAVFVSLTIIILSQSSSVIEGMANTIYPGRRIYLGGDGLDCIFNGFNALYYSITPNENPSNTTPFFTLFPFPLAFGLFTFIKSKDKLIFALVCLEIFFLIVMLFPIPEVISTLLLISHFANSNRLLMPIGFLDVLLFILSLLYFLKHSSFKGYFNGIEFNKLQRENSLQLISVLTIAAIFTLSIVAILKFSSPAFWSKGFMISLFFGLYAALLSLAIFLIWKKSYALKCLAVSLCSILFISGICVHPIQRGLSPLVNTPIYEAVNKIAMQSRNSLWLSEGSFVYGNFLSSAGAVSINSTNYYPNIDLWNKMDPNGVYEQVYMRYSNISTVVENQLNDDEFELLATDHILIRFTPERLKQLNVEYLLAAQVHENTDQVEFKELFRSGNLIIYKLNYS